jgi:uncharacterized protein DUF4855
MAVGPSAAQGSAVRWVLVYTGGPERPAYTVADLVDLLAVVDSAGHPTRWLCDGAILLEFHAVSSRYYMPWVGGAPTDGGDWSAYLDSVFQRGGPLTRLDSATASIASALGDTRHRVGVAIMIPYPFAARDSLRFEGRAYSRSSDGGRAAAVGAYARTVTQRFRDLGLGHVDLAGFYWLNEGITAADTGLVRTAAADIHSLGTRFYWIPSFGAAGAERWHAFGFDDAWLQPNYFFHPEVPSTRLDSAVTRARAAGMGLELELDRRLFGNDWHFADRLLPYLSAFEAAPDLRGRSIAIYEGAGALIQLARSKDAWHRAIYERLVSVLTPPPGSH